VQLTARPFAYSFIIRQRSNGIKVVKSKTDRSCVGAESTAKLQRDFQNRFDSAEINARRHRLLVVGATHAFAEIVGVVSMTFFSSPTNTKIFITGFSRSLLVCGD
jgi:hypothetical protein